MNTGKSTTAVEDTGPLTSHEDFLPTLVDVTGVVEIVAAIALLVPRLRTMTGWTLILMLVLFLPVNIYAAVNHAGMGGHEWGPIYPRIRIPL